jgi:ADP-ribose pyrophosphatase YjhB (NUDIX family)
MDVVPAASAVILDPHRRVLLVRRAQDPQRGRWSVPGGRVEPGETPEQAAAREVLEETGLTVEVGRPLWMARVPAGTGREYAIHGFAAEIPGDVERRTRTPTPGDDVDDARWVAPDDLRRMRLTRHLADRLRRAGAIPPLPRIDEHAVTIDAPREVVWSAVAEVLERAGPRWFAAALGCEDVAASGPRPLADGSELTGFHVTASHPPAELALAGRHRYSEYELVLRLDLVEGDRTRLRAETSASFPGELGAAYRALLMRGGLHAVMTRRLLAAIARAAIGNAARNAVRNRPERGSGG